MNAAKLIKLIVLIALSITVQKTWAQKTENWTSRQLMAPADLAKVIQAGKDVPVIVSVGPGAPIPNSIDVGMGKDQENLEKLKKELSGQSKETTIVIYCGCCPFERCPNVRPTIEVLKEMKFTNYKLLNLPNNIKADWIDKGYPVTK